MHADYYLNPSSAIDQVQKMWQRFLAILNRGAGAFIPTDHEVNMYNAYTAMYNSHCLSRAVGASLVDKENQIISVGWNDVPKAGGGVYGKGNGNHCFLWNNPKLAEKTPGCHKDLENENIVQEIRSNLKSQGIDLGEKEEYIIQAIGKLQVKGLLEFSRSVHAEMHAIIKGSQAGGNRVKEGTLYVTAFPCHNCARHIILSGVRIIYFIEPFVKSRAIKLHNDSLVLVNNENEIDCNGEHKNKVILIPYQGVGGKSFDLFSERRGDLKKVTGHQKFTF